MDESSDIINSISFSRVFSLIEIEILELSTFKTLIFFDLKQSQSYHGSLNIQHFENLYAIIPYLYY